METTTSTLTNWRELDATIEATERQSIDELNGQELADALDVLDIAIAELKDRRDAVAAEAYNVIDGPVIARSGRVLAPDVAVKRTGWDKRSIREAVVAARARTLLDRDTGEEVDALPVREIGDTVDVRTALNMFRGLGLDPDSFCTKEVVGKVAWK